MKNIPTNHKQAGAVSIFVVIFAALLMSVITVGFIRLMVSEQQKAAENDLSQSAYDSAMTGVEDAKRAILRYQNLCNSNPASCDMTATQLTSETCNAGVTALAAGANASASDAAGKTGEVMIQQRTGDRALDQAYTCVTVDLTPGEYVGSLEKNASTLVPLKGTGAFDRVTVEWFNNKDTDGKNADLVNEVTGSQPILEEGAWPVTRPSVMRAGLMQFGSDFTLQEFDSMQSGQSNANALFLYPTANGRTSAPLTGFDVRSGGDLIDTPARDAQAAPLASKCNSGIGGDSGAYSCKITLELPEPIGGGDRTAYLRLTSLYNKANFRLTLSNGSTSLQFKDTQAAVDSTGRANDLFRRVQSRVDLVDTSFPYPAGALDLGGSLCKSFSVDDTTYYPGSSCTP